MKAIHTFRMTSQTVLDIDAYEAANFTKPTKLWDRLVKVLPQSGEVQLDFVMASTLDKTVAVIYTADGVQSKKDLAIEDKGGLGYHLFLHCVTTAPISAALAGQYGFANAYFLAQKLAVNVIPGDVTTYPEYVQRILPEHFAADDYDFNVFRFALIGESRDPEYTVGLRACLRHSVISSDEGMSNNVNEVFPMMQVGPYITFNSYIPFPAQILPPQNDNSVLPIADKYSLRASEAVEVINDRRFTLSVTSGISEPEVAVSQSLDLM